MDVPAAAAGEPEAREEVYLTSEEALRTAFPEADEIRTEDKALSPEVRSRAEQALGWRIAEESFRFHAGRRSGEPVGYALVMEETGRSEKITFLVRINPDGRVGDVWVMVYREPIGSEVRRPAFLKQFRGKGSSDKLRVGRNIRNITGASLSCRAVAAGVRKAVVLVNEVYLKK